MAKTFQTHLTSNHWGLGLVEVKNGQIVRVANHPLDPDPPTLNDNIATSLNGRARILKPSVRASWLTALEDGSLGARQHGERGRDPFIELSWDEVLDLVAMELRRVRGEYGSEAIFAGSYGWASSGRFHHAQSQLKRFLNTLGGFVRSEGNYSYNAALVALPHITGGSFRKHIVEATRWSVIAEHTDLVVAFGGLPHRNTQVSDGGLSLHRAAGALSKCAAKGVRFINISPLRSDLDETLCSEWLPPQPGSDTAVMMGLAHTLIEEGLHDRAFLDQYTVGFNKVEEYLLGRADGVVKSADWASEISGVSADRLRRLAREMASRRTMITTAAGLQRADWGEQPLWMTVTLAAILGQIGLPGGGYTIGYAVNGNVGHADRPLRAGALPQGVNPVKSFIPVAMIADMLLNPGASYRYNGAEYNFPDIRLLWWAGGNPFHHHQNLNRLRKAFQRPETVIINEITWTATARHADIVLPVAAAQERCDYGAGNTDNFLVPMPASAPPRGEARVEYNIYAALADRLGVREDFTEGLSESQWLHKLWEETRAAGRLAGFDLPNWATFIAGEPIELSDPSPNQVFLADFRLDPEKHPRPTPSGRIELFSEVVAGFGLKDCPGRAHWNQPRDVAAGRATRYPLALLSGQPKSRLHSQYDDGLYSLSHKIQGREPVLIHPDDAAEREINDGEIVELYNDRGRCLAGARVTNEILPGVVFLWTGAWYDPDLSDPHLRDRHGNPNVLTHDHRTSEFSQGPASHSTLVELRRLDRPAPQVRAHDAPQFVARVGHPAE